MNNCFSTYHRRWINSGTKSIFIFDNIPPKFGSRAARIPSRRRQTKLLQALVKLLRCHFLNGWVQFLLFFKPSWKTWDVSLFSLWWFYCSTVFINKALYFDFLPKNMWLERLNNLPLNTVTPNFVAIFVFFGTASSFIERISFEKSKRNGKPFCFSSASRRWIVLG